MMKITKNTKISGSNRTLDSQLFLVDLALLRNNQVFKIFPQRNN